VSQAKASERSAHVVSQASAPTVVRAYADGACSGNPGPAGLGVVWMHHQEVWELSEYLGVATNNIAELRAISRVLQRVAESRAPVEIHTDSQYSIGVLQLGWKAKANTELVAEIRQQIRDLVHVRLHHVRGHSGHVHNERADALARAAIAERHNRGWVRVK
jgi:ribonuclease HI